MTIEKLNSSEDRPTQIIIDKINELIEAYNNHFHHGRELQFGTDGPTEMIPVEKEKF